MTDARSSGPAESEPTANFADQRRLMVEQQLAQRGIRDRRVLQAMLAVPREVFVPEDQWDMAYADGALSIGFHQTISQPYTVAFMCEAAQLGGGGHVLEIGTGCGYGAAVLAELSERVDTIEIIPELAVIARTHLARIGCARAVVHVGDGTLGLAERAPYDAIVVTAGATGLPEAFIQQLSEGGRIIIPIGNQRHSQIMYRFTRRGDRIERESLGSFAFVPLVGAGRSRALDPDMGDGPPA